MLSLADNKLTGIIPTLNNLPNLSLLRLEQNQLTGIIPNFISFKISNLSELGLFENCGLIAFDSAQETILNQKDPNWKTRNPNCGTTCVDTNGSTQEGINLVKSTPSNYGLFTQTQIDAAKQAGIDLVKAKPADYNLFTQTQIDAAKQTGIDLVKTKPNDYNLFSATDVSNKETIAKQTGVQEGITQGINKCKTDPVSCGIVVSNEQCKTNPASCNLFTQTQIDAAKQDAINKCKLDPASCGIVVSNNQCPTNPASCNLVTQEQLNAEKETAKQNGIDICKNDPNCKGIHATYNPLNGEVHIPFIDVPNGLGFVQTFDVYLIQRNGSFIFDLDMSRISLVH